MDDKKMVPEEAAIRQFYDVSMACQEIDRLRHERDELLEALKVAEARLCKGPARNKARAAIASVRANV